MADEKVEAGSDTQAAPSGIVEEYKAKLAAMSAQQAAEQDTPPADTEETKDEAPPPEGDQAEADGFQATERQRQLAKQVGLTDEAIDKLSEAEIGAYEHAGVRMSQVMSKQGRRIQELEDELKELRSAKPPRTDRRTETAGGETTLPQDFEFTVESFDAEGSGYQALNALQEELRSLRVRLDERDTADQQQQEAEIERATDTFFDGLDQEVYTRFGKGGDLLPQEEEARSEVTQMAAYIANAHEQGGESITVEQSLSMALNVVCADEIERRAKAEVRRAIDKRAQGRSIPPTQRPRQTPEKPQTMEEKAEAVRHAMAEKGSTLLERR